MLILKLVVNRWNHGTVQPLTCKWYPFWRFWCCIWTADGGVADSLLIGCSHAASVLLQGRFSVHSSLAFEFRLTVCSPATDAPPSWCRWGWVPSYQQLWTIRARLVSQFRPNAWIYPLFCVPSLIVTPWITRQEMNQTFFSFWIGRLWSATRSCPRIISTEKKFPRIVKSPSR
jgi:hypothetical protein